MDIKKIGIWAGAFIGSFLVLLIIIYFLFPYLNPEKAATVEQNSPQVQQSGFESGAYSPQAIDSLNQHVSVLQARIDSLQDSLSYKQQRIDSLLFASENNSDQDNGTSASVTEALAEEIPAIEEATKPLLSLEEDALAPIVDLLEEHQLISLYREGTGRQREKLLRTLKPEKAAQILKKVM